jgi:hypothetical protein
MAQQLAVQVSRSHRVAAPPEAPQEAPPEALRGAWCPRLPVPVVLPVLAVPAGLLGLLGLVVPPVPAGLPRHHW